MKLLVLLFLALSIAGCGKRKKGPAYKAIQISVGTTTTCAAMADGSVRCWGANTTVSPTDGALYACSSGSIVCVRRKEGVRCQGFHLKSEDGLLGDHPGVRELACSGDGLAWIDAAGDVRFGPETLHDVARVAAGEVSMCAFLKDGSVRCLGAPEIAVDLSRITDAADIAIGAHHACVLHKNETVSCWGKNDHGQLGDGSRLDRNTPSLVPNLTGVKHVAAGSNHTCIHRGDDTIRCWGSDSRRQLGLGGAAGDKDVPTLVPGLYEAINIAAGGDSTCALMTDGWIRCWGANEHGQLGDESDTDRAVPVPIKM